MSFFHEINVTDLRDGITSLHGIHVELLCNVTQRSLEEGKTRWVGQQWGTAKRPGSFLCTHRLSRTVCGRSWGYPSALKWHKALQGSSRFLQGPLCVAWSGGLLPLIGTLHPSLPYFHPPPPIVINYRANFEDISHLIDFIFILNRYGYILMFKV